LSFVLLPASGGGRQDFDVAGEWLLLYLRGAEIMI